MRPVTETRQALRAAASVLAEQRQSWQQGGALTWRCLAVQSQVGFEAARRTVDNMTRAGELQRVTRVQLAGCDKPYAGLWPANL